jgi:hypothetical protein
MTFEEKEKELAQWEFEKKKYAADPPLGFHGGHGYPDPEIYAFVDRLNALSRIATLQSCAGHRCTPESMCDFCAVERMNAEREDGSKRDVGEHVWNGQLWLWPDEKLAAYVYRNASALAQQRGVEKCGLIWHVEGREIIDVQFRGAGHGELDASAKAIALFFEEASWRCNL